MLWDVPTRTHITTLKGHTGKVSSLAVQGNTLFSGSSDTTIMLWDVDVKWQVRGTLILSLRLGRCAHTSQCADDSDRSDDSLYSGQTVQWHRLRESSWGTPPPKPGQTHGSNKADQHADAILRWLRSDVVGSAVREFAKRHWVL